jgi:predicted N-acetyltransferase YhbS
MPPLPQDRPSMTKPLTLRPETPADAAAVVALIERAFGPGRLVKVSERVRERAAFRPDLSMCAFSGDALVGCARMWDVTVGGTPVAFLGPLAVESGVRNGGVGISLVEAASRAAGEAGACGVLLVGDEAYFKRAGFIGAPAARIVMPGPVDQKRVLLRWLAPGPPKALAGPLT